MQFIAIISIGTSFLQTQGLGDGGLNFTYGLGALIGPNLGAALLRQSNWQTPFVSFDLGGVLITMIMFICVNPTFTESGCA